MATSLVVNGVSYLYPDTGDQSWGTVASAWAAAVTSGTLQKAGGTFTLTADVNFGATFGLISQYFKSAASNPASAGSVRLASTDTVKWRNNANGADIALAKDTSDNLTWAGNIIASSSGVVPIGGGGTGQTTKAAAMDALSPLTTKGDLIGFDGSHNVRFAAGADGTVLSYDSSKTSGFAAISVLTNPMTTLGDIIYENASPAATRLAGNTTSTKKFLTQTGTGSVSAVPAWDVIIAADVPSLAASKITSGTLATARGGTNLDTSASTGVAKISSGTWSVAAVAGTDFSNQSAGTYLGGPYTGSSAAPSFKAFQAPTVQAFSSTGTQTGWLFTISSGSATVGATYTNNSNTYTVLNTIASGTTLACSGTGATSGSTLTKSGGTGDATITFSAKVSLATYTPATGALYIKYRMVGGGGGGGGSGTGSNGAGGAGGQSFFGGSICNGGTGGSGQNGGTGGTVVFSLGTSLAALSGAGGTGSGNQNVANVEFQGGVGGSSPFGGAGAAGGGAGSGGGGGSGVTNSGSGGGGAGIGSTAGGESGPGGAAGGFIEGIASSLAASYGYVVGAAGTNGTAGTNGAAGGSAGSGYLVIEEYYQ